MTDSSLPRATLRWLFAPALTACLLPGWLAAQQPPDTTARPTPLSELVVTATRTTQHLDGPDRPRPAEPGPRIRHQRLSEPAGLITLALGALVPRPGQYQRGTHPGAL